MSVFAPELGSVENGPRWGLTSGLLVAAWPLTSLCMAWSLPLLLLIPYRGDIGDAFWLMGPYKDYRAAPEGSQCALLCHREDGRDFKGDYRRPGVNHQLATAGGGAAYGRYD